MPTAISAPLNQRVSATDIDELTTMLDDIYDKIALDDPEGDEYTVEDYLTDEAQQFVATRAVAGRDLPHNTSTARALAGANETLEDFHAAELAPRPPRRWGW